MSKHDTSPEFERELQALAAKSAHMYTPRKDSAHTVIPAEAVEAAREALEDALGHGFDDPDTIRKVLEAAAPHIIKAWINDMRRLPNPLPGYGPEGRCK